jgi:hypothetical protein
MKHVGEKSAGGNKTDAPEASGMRTEFYSSVSQILQTARSNVYRAINFAMVEAHWKIVYGIQVN